MNQINPLHIGGLLLTILIFSIVNLNGLKKELTQVSDEYKSSEILAINLKALKNVYANKTKIENSLNRILKQPLLVSSNLLITRNRKSIIVKSKSIKTGALNLLMSKILNASYNITKLKIKKLSASRASFEVEIKW